MHGIQETVKLTVSIYHYFYRQICSSGMFPRPEIFVKTPGLKSQTSKGSKLPQAASAKLVDNSIASHSVHGETPHSLVGLGGPSHMTVAVLLPG